MKSKVDIYLVKNPQFFEDVQQERVLRFSYESDRKGEDAAEEAFFITNAPVEMLTEEQCDIQNKYYQLKLRSVSVGDIVNVDGVDHLCMSSGWSKLLP